MKDAKGSARCWFGSSSTLLIFNQSDSNTATQGFFSSACQCQTMTYNMHTVFFFAPAESAILLPCESEFKHNGCKGCVWPVNSRAASFHSLPEALLFYLAEVHWLGSWTGDNLYTSYTWSGAPVSHDTCWLLAPPPQQDVNGLVPEFWSLDGN
jgi:hypothetical protein